MKPITMVLLVALAVSGCRFVGGRWVEEEVVVACPGGRVVTEKRITDTFLNGRVRNTTIRSNICQD